MRRARGRAAVLLLCLSCAPVLAQPAAEPRPPTRLHPPPPSYLLLRLRGDDVTLRYTPGALDRAARLQYRIEPTLRAFHRWVDAKLKLEVFVLSRREWEDVGYTVPYGIPVRVGKLGLAVPAAGDDGTVRLWSELLKGALPVVPGNPIRGTPREVATMALADFIFQLLVSEILVDETGLGGDAYWVRSLMTHLTSVDLHQRYETVRMEDLDLMYSFLSRETGAKAFTAGEYVPGVGLREWFWFQAQFHFGAQTILAKEGKGALKKMKKLRKKSGGALRGADLLERYEGLHDWYYASFATVSTRAPG